MNDDPPWSRRVLAAVARHASPLHLREALLCAPAPPALLIGGVAIGRPIQGAVAAGAAFAVGFGAVRELGGRRWAVMAAAALSMAAMTFLGSLAGQRPALMVLLTAVAAGAVARLALFDEALWWVALQATISFFVAGYYPGPLAEAAVRTMAVLIGGGAQMALVTALGLVVPKLPVLGAAPVKAPADPNRTRSHVIRAALAVPACLLIARALGLANYYWAPMTALLVLKPGLYDTQSRGLQRLSGTLAGCLIAGGFALLVKAEKDAVLVAITLAAALSYALQKASYAVFTVAVTATVVLLLTLVAGAAIGTAEHRLVATLLGGAIALAAAHITRQRRPIAAQSLDRIAD